jgi:hypothetical protein
MAEQVTRQSPGLIPIQEGPYMMTIDLGLVSMPTDEDSVDRIT